MAQSINRRQSNSGRVSYSDPVVLHETTRSRIVFVPFYIPHTNHQELAAKIQTFRKGQPPNDWILIDDKSISLKETAIRALLEALQSHLAVANENDGSFLLVRVEEGVAQLGEHDPLSVANALTSVLSQQEILSHISSTNLTDELASAFRGAIRLKEMQSAVAELKNHLDNGAREERIYQRWCDDHPWAFGNAYVVHDDDVRTISPHDQLDVMLSNVIAGYRDVVELKRPDMSVLHYDESHRNYYFSSDVSKTIGQCHRYLDVLHHAADRGLQDHPEIVAYHPRATIVIGRSMDWEEDKLRALHGLNSRLSGITIMTYDHLLAQGERLVAMLSASNENDEVNEEPVAPDWDPEIEF